MDVLQVQSEITKLENEILSRIGLFEKTTGCHVTSVDLTDYTPVGKRVKSTARVVVKVEI